MHSRILLAALLALPAALAACPVVIQSTDTQALFAEIPQLNTDLQTCPSPLTGGAANVVGNGGIQVDVMQSSGVVRSLVVNTANGQITGVTLDQLGGRWYMRITEANLDSVLAAPSRGTALAQLFVNRQVTIRPNTFFRRVGWFFTQPFVRRGVASSLPAPTAPTPPTGERPANCDETYMNGWTEYTPNKATWDSYMAQADGICQVKQGFMPDASKCVQSVQLSRGGIPFYLCWYKLG